MIPEPTTNNDNNRRIAKNTSFLYIRMLFTLGVSLYTSRVVLIALGVVDFGIYNVVAGVVVMFSFLNTSMSSATQRFLSFELGKKNSDKLNHVFSMSMNIHAIISFIIFILAETVGLWFLNTHMNIPSERIEAANWVYQFSILAFVTSVFSVPYNSIIIAHERMKVFAYISVLEVSLKLLIVVSLLYTGFDKLKAYALLTFLVTLIIFGFCRFYSKKHYAASNYKFVWDRVLYSSLMSYTGWSLFGNVAGVAMGQGINLLLNLFFGPVINAARGIAYQINGAINGFFSNFQMALNPQIVKSYAAKDFDYMHELILKGSKYSFFLLLVLAMPVLLETEIILKWWLKNVPDYSVIFVKLLIVNTLIDSLSGTLMVAAQATGEIKRYQLIVGGLLLAILPVSYLLFKLNYGPEAAIYVNIVVSVIALGARLQILKGLIGLPIIKFLKDVIFLVCLVSFISYFLPYYVQSYYLPSWIRFLLVSFLAFSCSTILIYVFGLDRQEKKFLISQIRFYSKKILSTYHS